MSNDGCQLPAWTGRPFAHLPYGPAPNSSYSEAPSNTSAASGPSGTRAATGVWNGPAPKGLAGTAAAAPTPRSTLATTNVADTASVHINGGRLPVVGVQATGMTPQLLQQCVERGVRHFAVDLSDTQQLEAVRNALQQLNDAGVCSRGGVFLSASVPNTAHRSDALSALCAAALPYMSHIDLLYLAWPEAWRPASQENDLDVSLKESWEAMEALVKQGMVKHLGLAHFSLAQVEDVLSWCTARPSVLLVELHPLLPQRKLVGVCLRKGVQCIALAPTAATSASLLEHEVVQSIAANHGSSAAQVVLCWNLQRGVPVILGSDVEAGLLFEPDCPSDFVAQLLAWHLTYDEKAALDGLETGVRFIAPCWHKWPAAQEGGAAKPSQLLLQQRA